MSITGLLLAISLVAFVGAGFATMLGATAVRERLFGVAVMAVTISLLVPLVERVVASLLSSLSTPSVRIGTAMPLAGIAVPFILGHLALGAVIIRRRLRGPDRSRSADDMERARLRERERLPAAPDGDDQ